MYAATLALVSRVASEAGPVLLVGHSMGGGIGTALAARHPELLRAAVLEEPAWRDRVERVQLGAVIDERIADSRRFRDDPVGALAAGRRDNPRWPEVEFEPWARAKTQVDLDFLALGVASLDRPWQDLVAAIGVPTLVVIGGQSTLITADALSQAAALGHAHVRIEVVPDAGHCVRRDLPDTFHGLVDPWLAAHA
jgi:lipase